MDKIVLEDLEVFYRVGVPDSERTTAQRLLITAEMHLDFRMAAGADALQETIDYAAVAEDLARFGEGRSWCLLEKLASDIADFVLAKYKPNSATVTVKKFVIPAAKHVAVSVQRKAA